MNWITSFVRPRIKSLIGKSEETSENLWTRCTACDHMLFQKDLRLNNYVCHYCNHHMRMSVQDRLTFCFDKGEYKRLEIPKVNQDPLAFRDSKRYSERLTEYRKKTGEEDALIAAYGNIQNQPTVIAAFNFSFMGGSMGMYVGEGLIAAAKYAVKNRAPLLAITASGGARMQEGILSLMQMPRSTIAVQMVKEAGLPYITLLTDPTTGGVSASFAMLGDVAFSEPGSTIGFTGARVIEETIRQKLPEGFQKAEYLLDHGMIDCVVERKDFKKTFAQTVKHLL